MSVLVLFMIAINDTHEDTSKFAEIILIDVHMNLDASFLAEDLELLDHARVNNEPASRSCVRYRQSVGRGDGHA